MPLILQGMVFIAFILGGVMIAYDWRYKAIPIYLLLLFAALSLIYGGMTHPDWQTLGAVMGLSVALFLYLAKKNLIGLADVLLITCAFPWIPLADIPIFLILCGAFGAGTALFWRWYYNEKQFPFAPAILCSLAVVIIINLINASICGL